MKRTLVQTEEGFNHMLEVCERHRDFAFDYETKPIRWCHKPPITSVSFAVKEENSYDSWYVPFNHQLSLTEPFHNMPEGMFWEKAKPLLEDPKNRKVMHSGQMESGYSKVNGIELGDNIDDTLVQAWMYDETRLYPYRLKDVTRIILGRKIEKLKNLDEEKDVSKLPISEGLIYGTNDSLHTLMLRDWFNPELDRLNVREDYHKIEMPIVRVLRDMVARGCLVDVAKADLWRSTIHRRQSAIEEEVYQIGGIGQFNIRSKQQLGNLMFDTLKYRLQSTDGLPIEPERTAKSGQYKLSDDVLSLYADAGFPMAVLMREHGDYEKLRGTYLTRLIEGCLYDGYYHPEIQQCGTKTGRYTSDMQQFPRDPLQVLDQLVDARALVCARPGHWLIVADYNQLELRVLAHYTEDPVLVACYKMGEDLHQGTADAIIEAGVKAFSRQDAKPINFGLVYGLALQTFIEMFGEKIGRAVHAALMRRFEGIFRYKDATIHQVHLEGAIRTIAWRLRRFFEINSHDWTIRGHAERAAFNTLIQGSAADLVKIAQLICYRQIPEAHQLLQVHDEVVFEFEGSKKDALQVAKRIKEVFESVAKLKVPLKADPGVGQTWRNAKAA